MKQQHSTTDRPVSQWQGSTATFQAVYRQILERWGEEEAKRYDPETNCFTFNTWRAKGYFVKKGEKALRSYTFVKEQEVATDEQGSIEVTAGKSHPKGVYLFFYLQVEKREKKEEADDAGH